MSYHERQGIFAQLYNTPRWMKFGVLAWTLMVVFYVSDTHITSVITSSPKDALTNGNPAPAEGVIAVQTHTQTVYITQTGAVASLPSTTIAHTGTLITYVYSESPESRTNLVFFLARGLHAKADFIFILNGRTDAHLLIPNAVNIRVVKRDNSCYDLGSHAEVLVKDDLYKKYTNFILMNASVRGPFIPHWSNDCWSERLVGRVTEEVKLVGVAINCWPTPHVQSMVWATDLEGLTLLLFPPATSPRHDDWMEKLFSHPQSFTRPADYAPSDPNWKERGLNQCFANRQKAVEGEISATGIILGAGKRVDVMLMKFQTERDYLAHCARLGEWDPSAGPGAYDGIDLHPFETLFFKSNRDITPRVLELLTGWVVGSNYSSYDVC